MYHRTIRILTVTLLLGCMLALEISSSLQETQTTDEGTHLAAGYSYLMTNGFQLNREHPPLIKELAALPLYLIRDSLHQPFTQTSWIHADQWQFAQDFLYFNAIAPETLLFLGRLPIMLLSLVLGFWIYRWTEELFGSVSGLIALSFYVFDPTIIAHSRYVTTDLALTLCFYITIYYFYKYLKFAKTRWYIGLIVIFAVAQASKFSAVFLIPILLVMYLISIWRSHELYANLSAKHFFKVVLGCLVATLAVLYAVYGFQSTKLIDDGAVQRLLAKRDLLISTQQVTQQDPLIQKLIGYADPGSETGKIIYPLMRSVPIPFLAYFDGLIQVYFHDYFGHTAYLQGNHTEFGWWYYFPIAVAVKTPAVTLIGLAALMLYLVYRAGQTLKSTLSLRKLLSRVPLHFYFLTIPPLLYFLISMNSSLNLGIRHVMIIYPFIFTVLGWGAVRLWRTTGWFPRTLIIGSGIWYLIASFSIYPHYLAYFNEFIGGPKNGYQYLVDSNNDWGQDVKKLKNYMNTNDIPYVCMVYFGQTNLQYYQIDYRYLPDTEHFTTPDDLNCVVVISITALFSKEKEYAWLQQYTPDTTIGYSLNVYDFRKND